MWSHDANEAEGKVEADLPTSWETGEINEGGAVLENGKRIKWEMMYGGHAELD